MQFRWLGCFCQCTQLFLSVLDWHQTCLLLCCCVCLLSVTRKCSLAGAASMTCSWHPRAIGCQAKALTHTNAHNKQVCVPWKLLVLSAIHKAQPSDCSLHCALCTGATPRLGGNGERGNWILDWVLATRHFAVSIFRVVGHKNEIVTAFGTLF